MAILTGRYGSVKWDATGVGSPSGAALANINTWKLDVKTGKQDVTCFGAGNKVYVPGLQDLSGSLAGFWDSSSVELFAAATSPTPGAIELYPNLTEPAYYWSGLAYMDASIDCSVDSAPKIAGTFMPAGTWTRH